MSMQFVSRTSLPELSRGATGKPSITINDNGQIVLSSKAVKDLGIADKTKVAMGFDTATRSLLVAVANPKIIKQVGENGCWVVRVGKTKQGVFAASAFLQDPKDEIFGEDGKYLYRESGNQTFDAVVDEKNKTITVTLPEGKLIPRPVVKRKPKVKNVDTANASAPVAGGPVLSSLPTGDELEDLNIEAA